MMLQASLAQDHGSQDPGSWGGHAVNAIGYASAGVLLVTWGRVVSCSWAFLERYCDEAFAVFSPDLVSRELGGVLDDYLGRL